MKASQTPGTKKAKRRLDIRKEGRKKLTETCPCRGWGQARSQWESSCRKKERRAEERSARETGAYRRVESGREGGEESERGRTQLLNALLICPVESLSTALLQGPSPCFPAAMKAERRGKEEEEEGREEGGRVVWFSSSRSIETFFSSLSL